MEEEEAERLKKLQEQQEEERRRQDHDDGLFIPEIKPEENYEEQVWIEIDIPMIKQYRLYSPWQFIRAMRLWSAVFSLVTNDRYKW